MFNIKENCKELKAKFQQKYPLLSEEHLNCNDGRTKTEMLENMQKKLGKTSEELYEMIVKL